MDCHERCLQLAVQLERHDDAAVAHAQLVQVGTRGGGRRHLSQLVFQAAILGKAVTSRQLVLFNQAECI